MEFVRTEVDGVPALWTRTEGLLQAGLVFRVGRVDETLARGGITHLVEHLALHGAGLTEQHNGATGPTVTSFVTRGDAEDISQFFATVCAGLADLPADRLPVEKSILRTEATARGTAVADPLTTWRFGPQGYGLPAYGEFGLEDLTIDDLRAWVSLWFTRGNAALWIAGGPPPPGLRLDLPEGPRRPTPRPTSVLPRLPAYFTLDVNGVAFDAVLERSTAATAYSAVVGRRLRSVLRQDLGLSYTTATVYQPLDAHQGMVTAFADALPDQRAGLSGPFVDVLIDLATGAVDEKDNIAVRSLAEDQLGSPGAAPARLQSAATNLLLGARVMTAEELRTELHALTPADIARVATEALGTALVMLPPGQAVGRAGFTQAPMYSADRVTGRQYARLNRDDDRRRLVIATGGVSLTDGPNTLTARFHDCAAMLAYPDGARTLFAPDAVAVHIEPQLWGVTPESMRQIDEAVPAGRVAHMPARSPESVPAPPPPVLVPQQSTGAKVRQRTGTVLAYLAIAVIVVAVAGLAVFAIVDGHSIFAVIGAGLVGGTAIRFIRSRIPQ